MHDFGPQQRGFAHSSDSTTPVYAEIETWFTRISSQLAEMDSIRVTSPPFSSESTYSGYRASDITC